jgi:hypothetical protein
MRYYEIVFFVLSLLYLLFSVGYNLLGLVLKWLDLVERLLMMVFNLFRFGYLQCLPCNNHFIVVVAFIATDFFTKFFCTLSSPCVALKKAQLIDHYLLYGPFGPRSIICS